MFYDYYSGCKQWLRILTNTAKFPVKRVGNKIIVILLESERTKEIPKSLTVSINIFCFTISILFIEKGLTEFLENKNGKAMVGMP